MKPYEAIRGIPGSVAVLDIGSYKVACFIAVVQEDEKPKILGVGHQLSKGIRSGTIADISEAETSIVAAVHAAEQMAGETVDSVMVSVSSTAVHSHNVSAELEISGDTVSERDVTELMKVACESVHDDENGVLHSFPIQYYLDQNKGLKDPRELVGDELGAELNIITAQQNYLKNLLNCIARCHLNVDEYVHAPHASALACLEEDEKELGATLIDLGGGQTHVAVFVSGKNIFSESIPVGGAHVTSDIAKGLSTSLQHAERIKTLNGSAVSSVKDTEKMVEVPQLGEEEEDDSPTMIPRSALVGIIRPRVEEIFELVRGRLEKAGVNNVAGRRLVLTGGGSQLVGTGDLAARILGKQVRKGVPHPIIGLSDSVSGPAFATAIGMLDYAGMRHWEDELLMSPPSGSNLSHIKASIIRWFNEHF